MKKRLIIGLVIGTAVFAAVFAAAATLSVNGNTLQAGNDNTLACDSDGVNVGYGTSFSDANDRYEVGSVTVSGIAVACEGHSISATLLNGSSVLQTSTDSVGTSETSKSITVSPSQSAANVTDVHVSIWKP